jgi:hypothetical protein
MKAVFAESGFTATNPTDAFAAKIFGALDKKEKRVVIKLKTE